jgi:hypothetical protein
LNRPGRPSNCKKTRTSLDITGFVIFIIILPNSRHQVKENEMVGHAGRMGEKMNTYRNLVEKPEGKRPLGRPRRTLVDNITMDLRGIGLGGMDWVSKAQDRDQLRSLVNTVMNLRVA